MKKIFLLLFGATLFSCSDFLDTVPKDQLSSATFWKTETDAYNALVGCYSGWTSGATVLYWDCASDIGFNFHVHEGWRQLGNGTVSASNAGAGFYTYAIIRRCNNFLANIDKITFSDPKVKANYIAQVKVIAAYKYALMNFWYGGVPLANELYATGEEAQIAKSTEQEVYNYVMSNLTDEVIAALDLKPKAGFIGKGAALAIKMRAALYKGDHATALAAANAIKGLGVYDLDPSYSNVFNIAGQSSKEIILAVQYIANVSGNGYLGMMYNNIDGGWSSMVPTRNLVDMYEMSNGLTKDEAGSGYDATYPFKGRDPRMAMSILYPGMTWQGRTLNTLDKTLADGSANKDFPTFTDNASKTGLTWGKYLNPRSQYPNVWNSSSCPILYRYAEVLLTIAECNIEMTGGNLGVAADMIDLVRTRAGMPVVDRSKYADQASMRELLRRERCVELAGEGLRRADIVRWKDASGKLVAETVLNQTLIGYVGTVVTNTDPFLRAQINNTPADAYKIEERTFKAYMRYLPFSQGEIDKNPKLVQNPGYI